MIAVQMAVDSADGAQRQRDALVSTALTRGVTLHFIDRQPAPTGDLDASVGGPGKPFARPLQRAHEAAQGELEMLARRTGGVLVASTNAGAAMRQVLAAERGAYLLGYYPDDDRLSGRPSKIRVTTQRKRVRLIEGSPHGPSRETERLLRVEFVSGYGRA